MVIDDFLSRYERENDYYEGAARLCAQLCETGLAQAGIRAMITFRAKRYERLEQKIQQRNKKNPYRHVEEIYRDIIDLAGVRIALYFPGDQENLHKFIDANFIVENVKGCL
jgi:ppGpp synthetase/RelA/SpoT-type nucleotidyltranferase